MKHLRTYWRDLFILALLLILPLLLYGNVTLGGKTMLPADNLFQWAPWTAVADQFQALPPQNSLISDLIIQNYAWKRFVRETLFAGDLPLWNPYLFAGAPFLAAGQHSAYYPFSIFFLILPLSKAYGWYTLIQLWLAGVFMYIFGRVLDMKRGSALLAGLVYQGGGYLVVSAAVFPMISGAVIWLPLLLACVEKVIGDRGSGIGDSLPATRHSLPATRHPLPATILWITLGAVALGMQILAGHIEYTIYTLLVMALYAAWRLLYQLSIINYQLSIANYRATITAFLALTAMVTIGLLLGAIQLVPLYELGQVNFRQEASTFDEVTGYAFPQRRVLTLALPNFFGNPTHHTVRDALSGEVMPLTTNYLGQPKNNTEWGLKNYVEGGIYLGILPLFLALLGLVGGWRAGGLRRWRTLFLAGLSAFSLAFIFGTPLYALIYYGIPFTNQLHTPFRWVFPLSLCVAVLAGFGAERLAVSHQPSAVSRQPSAVYRLPITVYRLPFTVYRLPFTILFWLALLGGVFTLAGLFVSRAFYGRFAPIIERVFLGLAGAPNGFPDAQTFYSYLFWQLLTLGLILPGVAGVLWLARRGSKRPFWLIAAALLIIVDIFVANRGFHTAVDPALLAYKPQMVQWLEQQPGQWRLTSFNPQGDKPFNANTPWLYDLQDVRGYDSIIPKQYTEYMAAIEPQNELKFNRVQPIANLESLNSPLLDVLNVKYVITTATIDLPKYEPVWQGEGVRVYENLGVAPRAYTLPQTATAVVDEPLTAMQTLDPRQYAVVAGGEWRVASNSPATGDPQPATLTPATITAYSNREVVVQTAVSDPSWLILNDSYFPGWNAFVRPVGASADDEVRADVIRVNGNFRGVQLDPGDWIVRFRYSPASFWLGGLLSLMGAIILAFGLAVWGWRRFYRQEGALSTAGSIAKNSLAPMALNLFNKGIDFVFALYYLRVLGPADAGSYQTAITTAIIFEIISNFGLDILLIRDVSQERDQSSHYLLNTTVLRLGAGVVAALPVFVLIGGAALFGDSPLTNAEITAILLIMVGMIFSGMSKGVTGLFYVHEEAEVPATMTTVTTILKVGLGVVALLLGFGFVGLAAVSIIVNVITLAALLGLALRRYPLTGPWRIDWALQRQMVRAGFPLMLIHLLQTVFISVDVLLLRLQLGANGPEVVGWYSSAYKWFNALQIVPSFFTLALFPIISREIGKSLTQARRMYQMAIKLMLLLALPIAVVTAYLAYPLVRILAGTEFLPHGAIALQLVILSIPIGWMNSVTNYVLIGLGLERMQPRAFTIAVLFNVITNLIFIPIFSYRAAAVTTILSEVVLLIVFEYYLRQKMEGVHWVRFLWRPLLVTAVMATAMLLGAQLHILVGLALGVLIYPAGLLLLGILGAEERRVLANILPAPIAERLKLI